MADPIVVILVFFGVIAVTGVIFCFWVITAVTRFGFRTARGVFRFFLPRPIQQQMDLPTMQCSRQGCGAKNRVEARFCRRCGQPMIASQRTAVRRVAMW
jgi:hypothetical protein